MEQEPHIIRRQLLELVTGDTAGSYALQDEVALLYNELVLPMIDRCFSEVSAGRHIAPIDRLELDLGTIDRNNLRYSFLQKAEAALRKKLTEIGGDASIHFEDTDSFAATGDSASLLEEEMRKVTGNDPASVPTISVENSSNMHVPDDGKTFRFNPENDSGRNEAGKSISSVTGARDVGAIPLIPPSKGEDSAPYQGRTIEFNLTEVSTAEKEPVEAETGTDDEVTDQVSDPTAADVSLKDNKLPFHGQTIHFNSEEDPAMEDDRGEVHGDDATNTGTAPLIPSTGVVPGSDDDRLQSSPASGESLPSKEEDGTFLQAATEPGTFDRQTSSPDSSSSTPISLIRFYLRTGLFPWWARDTSLEAFERAVRECILTGKDLPQLVALLNRPESLQRFTALPDEVVRAVAAAISPMNEATLSSMQPSWEKLLPPGRLSARQHWWITVFSASAARRLAQTKAYDPAETIAAFLEPYPEHPTEAREKKYRNTYSKRLSLLEKFFSQNGFAAETTRLRTAHELLSKKGNGTEEVQARQWNAVHDRLLSGQNVSVGALEAGSADREHARELLPAAEAQPTTLSKATEPVMNYKEKIFIDNAGLVLFWPYLAPFFERLELTDENRFKNDVSREKAMIALEILAYGYGDAPFFEASLPLNKVLCGVLPEMPVNTDHPFRKAELKTIDGLLAAAMEQSELGKNLSAAGFREAWVQRKGALSMRDGHWLLQVERKTYDVLLDGKLPWGIRIVKLPWTDNLLTVEW